MNHTYCKQIVDKAFKKSGGDFDYPTADSIMAVMDYLAKFSSSFRNPEIIKKHYGQVKLLLDKMQK